MTALITRSAFQVGVLSPLPAAGGGPIVNDGEGRRVRGGAVAVNPAAAVRRTSTRTAVVAGPSTTLTDGRASHAVPATGVALPASSLLILQGESLQPFRSMATGTAPADAYAVALPADVEVVHRAPAQIRQVTGVGYFSGVGDRASQRASTVARIDELKALAQIETDLAAEFGQPVKLAWDELAAAPVMLRPGDEGYSRVTGVNALLGRLGQDLKTLQLFTPDEIARLTA